MSFKGKVVIVTGSSSGIGAATAVLFAKEGADVVITARNEAKLKKVYDDCTKNGKTPLLVKADISDENQSKIIIDKTIAKFGKIDVLINNAGYNQMATILDGNLMKSYDGVMNTNLRPVFYLTMLAAPHLIKTKGNIINISSVGGVIISGFGHLSYNTSKAGLNHFTRGCALELGSYGVRVNGVSPGPVRTDILDNLPQNLNWDDIGQNMTLLKRVSESEEVADLILFIASDKAKGITGSLHFIDNGRILKCFAR